MPYEKKKRKAVATRERNEIGKLARRSEKTKGACHIDVVQDGVLSSDNSESFVEWKRSYNIHIR